MNATQTYIRLRQTFSGATPCHGRVLESIALLGGRKKWVTNAALVAHLGAAPPVVSSALRFLSENYLVSKEHVGRTISLKLTPRGASFTGEDLTADL